MTNDSLLQGDWTKGPSGTGEASWSFYMFPKPGTSAGSLVESWELVEPDTLVFHIRKGVRYALDTKSEASRLANGRELTANDVASHLKLMWQTPRSYFYMTYPWDKNIKSITTPDKWTVVIETLPGKSGDIFEVVTFIAPIAPPEVLEKYDMSNWKNSVGTGPFILTSHIPAASLDYERNPNYWMKDPFFPENTLPYLDGVKILVIPDASTRYAALRTAKLDRLGGMSAIIEWEDGASVLKTNPELNYRRHFDGIAQTLAFRVDRPEEPTYDIRVRRALAMAVDQKKILDTYYGGQGVLLSLPVLPVPEFEEMYWPLEKLPESVREQFEYYPDKARKLLAEAGYPKGFKARAIILPHQADLMSIVKAYFADVGVDFTFEVKESGAYYNLLFAKDYPEMIGNRMTGTLPFTFVYWLPGYRYNASQVNDPAINKAAAEIAANYWNYDKKTKLMKEIVPYMLEQAYNIQFANPYTYIFWQPWVKGYSGESRVGRTHHDFTEKFSWIDQSLKQKMTGQR